MLHRSGRCTWQKFYRIFLPNHSEVSQVYFATIHKRLVCSFIIFARILGLAFVSAGPGRGQFELIDGFKTILSQREQ